VLNMFRTLIYPSSGACGCAAEASACKTNTTQNQPHQSSNTQRTENKTTDVVIQQHSRKLLMMDILMSETCWAHKKWNKITSDIKLVFHYSTITQKCWNLIYQIMWHHFPLKSHLHVHWTSHLKQKMRIQEVMSWGGHLWNMPNGLNSCCNNKEYHPTWHNNAIS
jgi:hypothetical protein